MKSKKHKKEMKIKPMLMGKKHVQERRAAYGLLLALPPIASLAMIFVIMFTNQAVIIAPEGVMLSPVKDSYPLILSLSIFTVGYLVFISLLFKDSLKEFLFTRVIHRR